MMLIMHMQKHPVKEARLDKEVMKVDERVNIVYMIYKGDFLKLFPLKRWNTRLGIPLMKHFKEL